jgi:hypothetical protein
MPGSLGTPDIELEEGQMRTMVAVLMVILTMWPALARKAPHHHLKRHAAKHATITNVDRGGAPRHPDDVRLDRKIGSICRGC